MEDLEIRKSDKTGKLFSIKDLKQSINSDNEMIWTFSYAGDKESALAYIETLKNNLPQQFN